MVTVSKATANSLACMLIIAVLVSFPAAWAVPPVTPDGGRILNAGHQYNLQLQGIDVVVGQDNGQNVIYNTPKKDMTVTLGRTDLGNLMMEFRWTHNPGTDVPATNYAIILGFDFDNDGLWKNPDDIVYTPDDALGLVTLGLNIDICLGRDCSWLNIFIPSGLYVASWGVDPNNPDGPTWVAIGGPPGPQDGPHGSKYEGIKGPGPLYPGTSEVVLFNPYYTDTSYVMKVGVPLRLFHSPSGFGFFLSQQTAVCVDSVCGNPWLTWLWPTQGTPPTDLLSELGNKDADGFGTGAALLGNLDPNAEGPYNYVLQDPPGPDGPVGGFATAVDRIALVAPWIAVASLLGVALVLAVTMAKRRKV